MGLVMRVAAWLVIDQLVPSTNNPGYLVSGMPAALDSSKGT